MLDIIINKVYNSKWRVTMKKRNLVVAVCLVVVALLLGGSDVRSQELSMLKLVVVGGLIGLAIATLIGADMWLKGFNRFMDDPRPRVRIRIKKWF